VPDELRAFAAFIFAAALMLAAAPVAIRIAIRSNFLDHPVRDKKLISATPYLGGMAVMFSFTVVASLLGSAWSQFAVVMLLALALAVMGTIDDRRTLRPGLRFGFQLVAGLVLWIDDIRWEISGQVWIDLLITLIWVAGLANAFNLLDNIDGATATTAAVSAAGIGVIALSNDAGALAATAFALSGACAGFLFFNLAKPAKIFLGDGGSLPIGFLIAALAMLIPTSLGQEAILAAVPIAGIAIFDTSLVVLSRTRRGVSILTGGRDHTTHRLLARLKSTRVVAAILATAQIALCGLALQMHQLSEGSVVVVAVGYVLLGALALAIFERPESAAALWSSRVE
jgi:UDP-GlcNAc:undecaprenyl-phosphate GlcNAc-1-phosphate transferase